MNKFGPLLVTGILCVAVTLLITYLLWGSTVHKQVEQKYGTSMVDAAAKAKSAVVFIHTLTSDTSTSYDSGQTGSGVFISEDGYIATNYHVIARGSVILVLADDKHEYIAQLIGSDSTHDVALIKVNTTNQPFLEWGNSDSLRVGEQVLAAGSPYKLHSTVTAGFVSAKDRDVTFPNNKTRNFIQTDVPINFGNSGGALVNISGQLVGLNIGMITTSGQYEGYSFALPANMVKKITDDIRQFGFNQKASLGMNVRPVTQEIAHESGMNDIYGVVIDALTPGGAADAAGLQSLDIVLSFDGAKIQSYPHLMGKLHTYRPGDTIAIGILRNGVMDTMKVGLRKPE